MRILTVFHRRKRVAGVGGAELSMLAPPRDNEWCLFSTVSGMILCGAYSAEHRGFVVAGFEEVEAGRPERPASMILSLSDVAEWCLIRDAWIAAKNR